MVKKKVKVVKAEEKEIEQCFVKGAVVEEFFLPDSVILEIDSVCKERGISEKQKREITEEIIKKYDGIAAEAGESAGMVAAQSIGEPGTQLTLRTKHYAGAAEVSVGSGIQRVEEIVDGRSKAKYPTMTIHFKEADFRKDQKKVERFAKSLIDVRVEDVAKMNEDLKGRKVDVEFNETEMDERGVDRKELVKAIEENLKMKGKLKTHAIEFDFDKIEYIKIRRAVNKLKKTRIQGIKGINKTIVAEENNEFVVKTSGTNLKAIIKMDEIDGSRTTTNDIREIQKVLGIEAGRMAIITELKRVLDDNDIAIDVRHIMLLADLMTFSSDIRGIVRTGIAKEKVSPFARASFEETVKHLIDAAFRGEIEKLDGVVENIIVGLPAKIGTGTVKLVTR